MNNNNGNHYFEHYAKITLVDYYIFDKDSLIVRDKPDLQSERLDYGIEVTQAISRAEALGYEEKDKTRTVSRLDLIRERIADKLEKLNHNYKIFAKNALYVFVETARLEESDFEMIRAYIHTTQSEHAITYDVYFLNCISKLCIYDAHKDSIDIIHISASDLRGLKQRAKLAAQNE